MWKLIVALVVTALALVLLVQVFKARPKAIPVPKEQIEEVAKKLAKEPLRIKWDVPDDPKAKG